MLGLPNIVGVYLLPTLASMDNGESSILFHKDVANSNGSWNRGLKEGPQTCEGSHILPSVSIENKSIAS